MNLKPLFTLFLASVLSFSSLSAGNQFGRPENFSDLVLIYAGNTGRQAWNKAQLTPYVTHTFSDGSEKWFFDAFLFLEFIHTRLYNGKNTTFGFGNGMGGDLPATQEDWQWILDSYFTNSTAGGTKRLAALDELIGDKIKTLGQPPYRHKVIIVCPAPKKLGTAWSTETWGNINGKAITFESEANRLAAVKWYIDQLIDRWNKANYKNIDLEGIYWIEEGMITNAGIIANVNDYARSKGLRTYWIPYYHSGNQSYCQRWRSTYKFDMCYYQPGYAFYRDNGTTYPKSQLNTVCTAAQTYNAGVEVEFETTGTNNALHSVDAAAHQRLNDYLDVFTQTGAVDQAGIAYYVGSRGLNDMASSTDPVDHATIDRMASIVNQRLIARYGEYSAIEEVDIDNNWAYAGEGAILTTAEATCYDLAGRVVHQGCGLFECPPGVYIVNREGAQSVKLLVR